MALPNPGVPLSLADIAAEYGDAPPHSLNEFYSADAGVPSEGTIDIDDFYGTSNVPDWSTGVSHISKTSTLTAAYSHGNASSLSADGSRIVTTDAAVTVSGVIRAGASTYYLRSGNFWNTQQTFSDPSPKGDDVLGDSCDISADGSIVVIGAPHNDDLGSTVGKAMVHTRSGETWSFATNLYPFNYTSSTGGSQYGRSCAISGDGTVIVVGAPVEDSGQLHSGAAFIYTKSGSSWVSKLNLKGSPVVNKGDFGRSIAISYDASIIAISAPGEGLGVVYTYIKSADSWVFQQKLPSRTNSQDMGTWVDMSDDGSILIVSDPQPYESDGNLHVYKRSGNTYNFLQSFQGDFSINKRMSGGVSISGDGKVIAACHEEYNSNQGAVSIYTVNSGGSYSPNTLLTVPGSTRLGFGQPCLSEEGRILIVGDRFDQPNKLHIFYVD